MKAAFKTTLFPLHSEKSHFIMDHQSLLGQPALIQLLNKSTKTEDEKKELMKKVENNCRSFDKSQKGKLTVDDLYNVVKCQVHVDCTKNDIRKLVADLPMDKNYKISIDDFCRTPILSDEVFKMMDKNNDGHVSKGEIKLARKNLSMKEIDEIIKEIDGNSDGKLSYEEMKKVCAKVALKEQKNSKKK